MRRPDVFNLDYSHPLAQGLVFAGLGQPQGAARYSSAVFGHAGNIVQSSGGARLGWVQHAGRWMLENNRASQLAADLTYVDIPHSPVLSQPAGITVSALIVPYEISVGVLTANHHYIVTKQITTWDPATLRNYSLIHRNRTILFSSGAGNIEGNESAINVAMQACAVSVSFDGATIRLFVNGVQQDNTLSVASLTTNTGPLRILRSYAATTAENLKGLVGDICIHNRALSPTEIAILADRTDPMLGGLIVEERPVLYFDMGGSTVDALTASNLTVSAPVLGTPALGQAHALTASGIIVEGPVLGAPVLAQIHVLTAQNFTASSPVLGAPALTQAHALTATGLTIASPALGTPTLGQVHALTASNLAISSPVLGTPSLVENAADVDALTAVDLVVGSPVLGTPALTQVHVLGSDGLVTGSPVLGSPAITQIHVLEALGLMVGAPVLGAPELNKTALDLDITANLSSVGLDVMYLDSIGTFTAQLTSSGCKLVTLRSVGNFEVAEREE